MKLVVAWFLPFIALFFNAFPALAAFDRDLRWGDRGEAVRELQRILNTDPATAVAAGGPGSFGEETDYFGVLTFSAVKRFQAKYAAEVLNPAGLVVPSGFVGPLTRAKLATLRSGGLPAVLPASVPPAVAPVVNPPPVSVLPRMALPPAITGINPVSGRTGTVITVTGRNFQPAGNIIYTGYDRQIVDSSDGTNLTFTFAPPFVPAALPANLLDYSAVPFRFYVKTDYGLSEAGPEFQLTFN